jgi:hypothetical protein
MRGEPCPTRATGRYPENQERRVWIAGTLLSAKSTRALHDQEHLLAEKELGWLETFNGTHVLELCVADAGIGIPRTLSVAAQRQLPRLVETLRKLSAGTTEFAAERAAAHQMLCDHAFRHDSTRKSARLLDALAVNASLQDRLQPGIVLVVIPPEELAACQRPVASDLRDHH